jgi:hypothetical protein
MNKKKGDRGWRIKSSRPSWVTQQDPVSGKKKNIVFLTFF